MLVEIQEVKNPYTIFVIIFCLLYCTLDADEAQLIEQFLTQPLSMESHLNPSYVTYCTRLGKNYPGVSSKARIGYGFTEMERQAIQQNPDAMTTARECIGDATLLRISHPDIQRPVLIALKDSLIISPYQLQSESWTQRESQLLHMRCQDTQPQDSLRLQLMDEYIRQLVIQLNINPVMFDLLHYGKIVYYRVASEESIERFTGYRCRGMGIIAEDAVVSRFCCHLHELSHIIINLALPQLPLYTHPFLQEGFAVATGGRGGQDASVLLDTAVFLCRAGFISPVELFDASAFRSMDAGISYPVAGLYTRFLMQNIGMETYKELYRKYSNGTGNFASIDLADLPADSLWQCYLAEADFARIQPQVVGEEFGPDVSDASMQIAESTYYVQITARDGARFSVSDTGIRPDNEGRYKIEIQDPEIKIIDTLSEICIAHYAPGLATVSGEPASTETGTQFYLSRKSISAFHAGFGQLF